MNDEEQFEKFFKAIKGLGLVLATPLIAPKWQLIEAYELAITRGALSLFATDEQVNEIEESAYAYAVTKLESNHVMTLALMYEAYNVFASGGNYEQAIAHVKSYSSA